MELEFTDSKTTSKVYSYLLWCRMELSYVSMLSTTSSELQNSVSLSVYPIRMNTAYTLTVMVWRNDKH